MAPLTIRIRTMPNNQLLSAMFQIKASLTETLIHAQLSSSMLCFSIHTSQPCQTRFDMLSVNSHFHRWVPSEIINSNRIALRRLSCVSLHRTRAARAGERNLLHRAACDLTPWACWTQIRTAPSPPGGSVPRPKHTQGYARCWFTFRASSCVLVVPSSGVYRVVRPLVGSFVVTWFFFTVSILNGVCTFFNGRKRRIAQMVNAAAATVIARASALAFWGENRRVENRLCFSW